MRRHSTRQAADKLGIDHSTLANYIATGKVPAPETVTVGRRFVHMWTDDEIERVRKLLPKIANGRKTRYQKQKGKTQKPQPRAAVPHNQPKKKK